eukprot:2531462-Alexandrium_andersonii.AAC.1
MTPVQLLELIAAVASLCQQPPDSGDDVDCSDVENASAPELEGETEPDRVGADIGEDMLEPPDAEPPRCSRRALTQVIVSRFDRHTWMPAGVGSKAASLPHKVAALLHQLRMESTD